MATTPIDLNPFPLGGVTLTLGVPAPVTQNFPQLALQKASILVVQALAGNAAPLYVGRSNMNTTTLAGVLRVVAPGSLAEIKSETGAVIIELLKFYVVGNTGDKALVSAYFE